MVKIDEIGMSSKAIRMVKDVYSKMRFGIKEDYSRLFTSECDLLQGETYSPLFFSHFVNDIETSSGLPYDIFQSFRAVSYSANRR